ncbi:pyruvate decarboxylase-2 [Actinidia rufa]|uniref:Pyruvate decarboxylase-2 n=1 Tax=Actinidia rufa TaxID=165716 RepID=A0A7J0G131_9ERIC|nr:pyruvate decarboxylase-2 [Actinidia rufa]
MEKTLSSLQQPTRVSLGSAIRWSNRAGWKSPGRRRHRSRLSGPDAEPRFTVHEIWIYRFSSPSPLLVAVSVAHRRCRSVAHRRCRRSSTSRLLSLPVIDDFSGRPTLPSSIDVRFSNGDSVEVLVKYPWKPLPSSIDVRFANGTLLNYWLSTRGSLSSVRSVNKIGSGGHGQLHNSPRVVDSVQRGAKNNSCPNRRMVVGSPGDCGLRVVAHPKLGIIHCTEDCFPESEVVLTAPGVFDHCPTVATIVPNVARRKPFKKMSCNRMRKKILSISDEARQRVDDSVSPEHAAGDDGKGSAAPGVKVLSQGKGKDKSEGHGPPMGKKWARRLLGKDD